VNTVSRALSVLVFSLPTIGCATTVDVSPDNAILKEEVARLPPSNAVPFNVSIEIQAPVVAAGHKPGRVGEPKNLLLNYTAYQLANDAAYVCVQRWFGGTTSVNGKNRLSIKKIDLVYDEYTDTFAWRAVIEVNIEIQAIYGSEKSFNKSYSSGRLKGDWKRSTTERNDQYTRLIYRALLIALDKAMAELAQRLTASPTPSPIPTQRKLAPTAPP